MPIHIEKEANALTIFNKLASLLSQATSNVQIEALKTHIQEKDYQGQFSSRLFLGLIIKINKKLESSADESQKVSLNRLRDYCHERLDFISYIQLLMHENPGLTLLFLGCFVVAISVCFFLVFPMAIPAAHAEPLPRIGDDNQSTWVHNAFTSDGTLLSEAAHDEVYAGSSELPFLASSASMSHTRTERSDSTSLQIILKDADEGPFKRKLLLQALKELGAGSIKKREVLLKTGKDPIQDNIFFYAVEHLDLELLQTALTLLNEFNQALSFIATTTHTQTDKSIFNKLFDIKTNDGVNLLSYALLNEGEVTEAIFSELVKYASIRDFTSKEERSFSLLDNIFRLGLPKHLKLVLVRAKKILAPEGKSLSELDKRTHEHLDSLLVNELMLDQPRYDNALTPLWYVLSTHVYKQDAAIEMAKLLLSRGVSINSLDKQAQENYLVLYRDNQAFIKYLQGKGLTITLQALESYSILGSPAASKKATESQINVLSSLAALLSSSDKPLSSSILGLTEPDPRRKNYGPNGVANAMSFQAGQYVYEFQYAMLKAIEQNDFTDLITVLKRQGKDCFLPVLFGAYKGPNMIEPFTLIYQVAIVQPSLDLFELLVTYSSANQLTQNYEIPTDDGSYIEMPLLAYAYLQNPKACQSILKRAKELGRDVYERILGEPVPLFLSNASVFQNILATNKIELITYIANQAETLEDLLMPIKGKIKNGKGRLVDVSWPAFHAAMIQQEKGASTRVLPFLRQAAKLDVLPELLGHQFEVTEIWEKGLTPIKYARRINDDALVTVLENAFAVEPYIKEFNDILLEYLSMSLKGPQALNIDKFKAFLSRIGTNPGLPTLYLNVPGHAKSGSLLSIALEMPALEHTELYQLLIAQCSEAQLMHVYDAIDESGTPEKLNHLAVIFIKHDLHPKYVRACELIIKRAQELGPNVYAKLLGHISSSDGKQSIYASAISRGNIDFLNLATRYANSLDDLLIPIQSTAALNGRDTKITLPVFDMIFAESQGESTESKIHNKILPFLRRAKELGVLSALLERKEMGGLFDISKLTPHQFAVYTGNKALQKVLEDAQNGYIPGYVERTSWQSKGIYGVLFILGVLGFLFKHSLWLNAVWNNVRTRTSQPINREVPPVLPPPKPKKTTSASSSASSSLSVAPRDIETLGELKRAKLQVKSSSKKRGKVIEVDFESIFSTIKQFSDKQDGVFLRTKLYEAIKHVIKKLPSPTMIDLVNCVGDIADQSFQQIDETLLSEALKTSIEALKGIYRNVDDAEIAWSVISAARPLILPSTAETLDEFELLIAAQSNSNELSVITIKQLLDFIGNYPLIEGGFNVERAMLEIQDSLSKKGRVTSQLTQNTVQFLDSLNSFKRAYEIAPQDINQIMSFIPAFEAYLNFENPDVDVIYQIIVSKPEPRTLAELMATTLSIKDNQGKEHAVSFKELITFSKVYSEKGQLELSNESIVRAYKEKTGKAKLPSQYQTILLYIKQFADLVSTMPNEKRLDPNAQKVIANLKSTCAMGVIDGFNGFTLKAMIQESSQQHSEASKSAESSVQSRGKSHRRSGQPSLRKTEVYQAATRHIHDNLEGSSSSSSAARSPMSVRTSPALFAPYPVASNPPEDWSKVAAAAQSSKKAKQGQKGQRSKSSGASSLSYMEPLKSLTQDLSVSAPTVRKMIHAPIIKLAFMYELLQVILALDNGKVGMLTADLARTVRHLRTIICHSVLKIKPQELIGLYKVLTSSSLATLNIALLATDIYQKRVNQFYPYVHLLSATGSALDVSMSSSSSSDLSQENAVNYDMPLLLQLLITYLENLKSLHKRDNEIKNPTIYQRALAMYTIAYRELRELPGFNQAILSFDNTTKNVLNKQIDEVIREANRSAHQWTPDSFHHAYQVNEKFIAQLDPVIEALKNYSERLSVSDSNRTFTLM